MPHVSRPSAWSRVAGSALLLACACVPEAPDDFGSTERQPFDATRWAAATERWSMCADLRREHLPVGMARADALQLLGSPMAEDASRLSYDVGNYWLELLFDPQGRLTETLLNSY